MKKILATVVTSVLLLGMMASPAFAGMHHSMPMGMHHSMLMGMHHFMHHCMHLFMHHFMPMG